jgi:hypothetical protein
MLRASIGIPCSWLGLVLLTVTPISAISQTVDSAAVVRAVFAFEDARFGAMVRADTAWLRNALADNLSYVHSSGRRENKAEYLAAVGSGTMRYEEFTPRERDARLLSARAVVVVGLAHARAVSNNQPVDVNVRYTAVYERAGESWRLVAWQTTRIP